MLIQDNKTDFSSSQTKKKTGKVLFTDLSSKNFTFIYILVNFQSEYSSAPSGRTLQQAFLLILKNTDKIIRAAFHYIQDMACSSKPPKSVNANVTICFYVPVPEDSPISYFQETHKYRKGAHAQRRDQIHKP